MNDHSSISTDSEITAEACAWLAQVESGELSASDLSALREWMGRSPAHATEIRSIAALSSSLSVLTEMAEPLAKATAKDNGLRKRRGLTTLAVPIAASCAVLAVAVALVVMIAAPPPVSAPKASESLYTTAIGEYRTIELADGSTVKLNTDTHLEVVYTDAKRQVRLQRGEAMFDVARDPSRAFVVYSGETAAEAIGTAFVVRLRDAVTELAVVEGVVGLSLVSVERQGAEGQDNNVGPASVPGSVKTSTVLVRAGEALSSTYILKDADLTAPAAPDALTERELQRRLSWTEGLFDFSDTPLGDVVEEINRHNDVRLEIVDTDLRDLKFGGIFQTSDVELLLEALEGLGVQAERTETDRILLRNEKAG